MAVVLLRARRRNQKLEFHSDRLLASKRSPFARESPWKVVDSSEFAAFGSDQGVRATFVRESWIAGPVGRDSVASALLANNNVSADTRQGPVFAAMNCQRPIPPPVWRLQGRGRRIPL